MLSHYNSAFYGPESINGTASGAILPLTVDLAYPVNCARLCHLLIAQHCCLCLNDYFYLFTQLSAPQSPISPAFHSIDASCDIIEKLPCRPGAFK